MSASLPRGLSKEEVRKKVEDVFANRRTGSIAPNTERYVDIIWECTRGKIPARIREIYGLSPGAMSGVLNRIRNNPILRELIHEADPQKQFNLGRKADTENHEHNPLDSGLHTERKYTTSWYDKVRLENSAKKRPITGVDIFKVNPEANTPAEEQYDSWRENL